MSQLNHSNSFSSFNLNTSIDSDPVDPDEPRRFASDCRNFNLEVPIGMRDQMDAISEISTGSPFANRRVTEVVNREGPLAGAAPSRGQVLFMNNNHFLPNAPVVRRHSLLQGNGRRLQTGTAARHVNYNIQDVDEEAERSDGGSQAITYFTQWGP